MKPTIRQTFRLIKLKMSRTELDNFEILICADKLALCKNDDKFFLITLEENKQLETLDITTIYRATKESIEKVFQLWVKDLMDGVENPRVEVDLLNLSEKD